MNRQVSAVYSYPVTHQKKLRYGSRVMHRSRIRFSTYKNWRQPEQRLQLTIVFVCAMEFCTGSIRVRMVKSISSSSPPFFVEISFNHVMHRPQAGILEFKRRKLKCQKDFGGRTCRPTLEPLWRHATFVKHTNTQPDLSKANCNQLLYPPSLSH